MKILIADSGSTKTDWCLLDLTRNAAERMVLRATTSGINPFQQSEEEIAEEVRAHLLPLLKSLPVGGPSGERPDEVQFYGAGCTTEKAPLVARALVAALADWPNALACDGPDSPIAAHGEPGDGPISSATDGARSSAPAVVEPSEKSMPSRATSTGKSALVHVTPGDSPTIEVHSDMLAAARALCGRRPGIACILGTGSNSCYYDGRELRANVPPLGFILGDEGSGAVLGRLLVGDLLKGQLAPALREAFVQDYGLSTADIIERVYRRPFANRFLASFAPFLARHREDAGIHRLLVDAFRAFLTRNVMHYDWQHLPAHFTGSIALHFQPELREAAASVGVQVGQVLASPMEGLIHYHAERP